MVSGKTAIVALAAMGFVFGAPSSSADPAFTVYAGVDTLDTESARIGVDIDGTGAIPVSFTGCGGGDTLVSRSDDVVGFPGATGLPAVGATRLVMTHLCMYTHDIPSHDPAYLSLQSERVPSDGALYGADAASSGLMLVTFDPSGTSGTFTSTLIVNYDLRNGLGGPIFTAGSTGPITSEGVLWERAAVPGDVLPFCHSGIQAPESWFVENHCVRHVSSGTGDFVPGKASSASDLAVTGADASMRCGAPSPSYGGAARVTLTLGLGRELDTTALGGDGWALSTTGGTVTAEGPVVSGQTYTWWVRINPDPALPCPTITFDVQTRVMAGFAGVGETLQKVWRQVVW